MSGDDQEETDVPTFRIVVVGELAPRADYRTREREEPTPRAIDRQSFDEVFRDLVVPFAIEIQDGKQRHRVDLRLDGLRGFRPDSILSATSELVAELDARHPSAKAPAKAPISPVSEPAASGSAIDSILDQVDVASPKKAGKADPVGSLVSAVARSARKKSATGSQPPPSGAAAAGSSAARVISAVLTDEEFSRLERLWRSVRLLVDHADKRRGVEVYLVSVDDEEIDDALDAIAEPSTGAFDLVILADTLVPTASSLERARRAADAGAAMHAPVLVSGAPALVGVEDLSALGRSKRKLSTVDDPRATLVRAAAASDAMRWLFVSLNGPWVRAPYDPQSARVREFSQDSSDSATWVAALPAFALAALCAKSFAETGWPTPVTGPQTMLDKLVVRAASDRGHTAALSVEAFISDDAARELAQAGIIAFGGVPNRDSAYVSHTRSMYRPGGPVPKDAEGSLADALFVGSLVRAMRELAAALPRHTPEEKIGHVAEAIVRDLLSMAAPPGPEVSARAHQGTLELHIRPHRFAGVTMEELSLDIPLG